MRGANGADDEPWGVGGKGAGEVGWRRGRGVYAGDGARGVEVDEELAELGSEGVSCCLRLWIGY